MFIKNFHIVVFILLTSSIKAQNLVPNYSFEAFPNVYPSLCGCGSYSSPWGAAPADTIFLTPPWYSPSTGSPDCFKPCSPSPNYGVPKNWFGFQYPRTGIGYVFIDCKVFTSEWKNFREYLQVKLITKLIAGKQYNVEFYISLMDSANYAVDRIGMYISDTAVWLPYGNANVLPFVPQISNPEFNYITDTANWVKISGIYTAHGGEQFITIGNFYDDDDTHQITTNVNSNGYDVGFYVDDVSITPIDNTKPVIFIPNIFSPNGDGANDIFRVRGEEIEDWHIQIYNRWGNMVFESKDVNKGWDGTYDGKKCAEAVYFWVAEITFTNGEKEMKKGDVSLVR